MTNIFLVNYHPTVFKNNGLHTYSEELVKGLNSVAAIRLHFVWLMSFTVKPKPAVEEIDGVVHYFIPKDVGILNRMKNNDVVVADFLASQIKTMENIIFHFNWINHCPFAWYLKQRLDCKVVLTKHCIPWRESITTDYALFKKLDNMFRGKYNSNSLPQQLIERQVNYELMDHFIAVTDSGRQSLIKMMAVPGDKITVINNGLNPVNAFSTIDSKAELRKKHGFSAEEKIILFAGKLTKAKGVYDLLAIFQELLTEETEHNLRLVIAGEGDFAKLFETIKGYWPKITFTGSLDKTILYEFYQLADVGIVPSYLEQCSYTTIEMMASSLPVIVCNVDGLSEIVPNDCGVKVELVLGEKGACINSTELKQKIMQLLGDEKLAITFASKAKVHVSNNFKLADMSNKTLQVYRNLLEKKSEVKRPYMDIEGPKVSILLPCYNAQDYIKDCLDSIFKQCHTNYEIIIVDDASTDNTVDIIKQYKDDKITLIRNRKNLGVAKSLNKGIEKLSGKYCARIDADDMMHEDRLSRQVAFLEGDTTYGLVGSWQYIINNEGRPIGRMEYPDNDIDLKLTMLFRNPFSHPTVMVKTAILKEVRYSNKFKHCEDYELWHKIARGNKIANLPLCLTSYRIHSTNVSGLNELAQKQNTLELISQELDRLNIGHTTEDLMLQSAIYFKYGSMYFNSGEKLEKLNAWVNRIFEADGLKNNFEAALIDRIKHKIVQEYCGYDQFL